MTRTLPLLALLAAVPAAAPAQTPAAPLFFQAQGQEPSWAIEIAGDRLRFTPGPGAAAIEARLAPPREGPGGRVFETAPGGPAIRVVVTPGPCRDSMSGVAFPERVHVERGGRVLSGCGGMPEARLLGEPWTVESIGGEAPAGRRPVTLRFEPAGRFGGQGPCNVFRGGWSMPEGRLVFTQVASTMMACPEPAMAQEQALFRLLEQVGAWRIGEDGALRLDGPAGAALVARR